jgi:hypothetical protein
MTRNVTLRMDEELLRPMPGDVFVDVNCRSGTGSPLPLPDRRAYRPYGPRTSTRARTTAGFACSIR